MPNVRPGVCPVEGEVPNMPLTEFWLSVPPVDCPFAGVGTDGEVAGGVVSGSGSGDLTSR